MNNENTKPIEEDAAHPPQADLSERMAWKYCPDQEGKFVFECSRCKGKNSLNSNLFLAESSKPEEGLIFTRQYKKIDGWITRKLGTAAAFIMALAIGSSIASALGSPPLLYAILAGAFLIPLKPICSFLFSRIDPGTKIPIWQSQCQNCGSGMSIASDGSGALLGQAIDAQRT